MKEINNLMVFPDLIVKSYKIKIFFWCIKDWWCQNIFI